MSDAPREIEAIDTRMWGIPRVTSAYLLRGEQPALVDTGPRTSFPAVAAALDDLGVGREDLAWIVLTHIHLDHCGGTGDLAERFPRARVIVHRRGARHLAEPDRLIRGSAAIYGDDFHRYGDLAAVDPERIIVAEDGHRVRIGPGRELLAVESPGHARHHNAYVDTLTGAVISGDVIAMELRGGDLFAALPPPDVDIAAARASVARIREHRPTQIGVGHFGWLRDPQTAPERSDALWARAGEAGIAGWRAGRSAASVGRALESALPAAKTLGPEGFEILTRLGWIEHSVAGLAQWAEAQSVPDGSDSK